MQQSLSPSQPVYLWGPIAAADKIGMASTASLPELEVGEWVYYENAGAYSMSMWMPFMGMAKPKVHYFMRESRR